ncbi:hypothetical protein [Methylobacterium ajmalii]|uniref:hypothetical protein n=1 Tax=Methylobacterium ajmalii TaxID=2738439 RepID=UPI002F3529F1
MSNPFTSEQHALLRLLFLAGPQAEDEIPCKCARGDLLKIGLVGRFAGQTFLTKMGIDVAVSRNLHLEKAVTDFRRTARFILVSDDAGHSYVIPEDRKDDWDTWRFGCGDDAGDGPMFAVRVEGEMTFTLPVVAGVPVIETLNRQGEWR